MDGLIEPSMPKLQDSVIQQMKEPTGIQYASGDQQEDEDEEDQALIGFPGEKKRFSFRASVGSKKRSTIKQDNRPISSMSLPTRVDLSAKQKSDIALAFEAFDVTGTGYMSTLDLRVALRALGFDAKKEETKKLLEMFDKGNSGRLCYADFMTIIEIKLGEDDTREDILKAFKLFDKENTGRLAFHNLRQVADELGEDVNDEEIAEMLAEADLDDDGTLDQEEFIKIMKKPSLY